MIFNPGETELKRVLMYYGIVDDDKVLCPFHDDKNPSMHINEGMFNCFACGASGDALSFVKLANPKLNGLDQLVLYHKIINSKKVRGIKAGNKRRSKKKKEVDKLYHLNLAKDYYFGLKSMDWRKDNSKEKMYMLSRGFTASALNECKAKLTYTSDNYPIIFPIFDMNEFKGYVCRTMDKNVEKKRKYLYNKGFSRRDTLAGRYDSKVVVMVEGYMDMQKLRQFGLKYVVAILGWKVTSQQVEKLKKKGVETIISALDTDSPGEMGTDYLHNFFNVVRFQFPKGAKDPGDLNEDQFKVAYRKTKALYRRRKGYVNSK